MAALFFLSAFFLLFFSRLSHCSSFLSFSFHCPNDANLYNFTIFMYLFYRFILFMPSEFNSGFNCGSETCIRTTFLFKNKNSYFQWMLAATILYLPFFWIRMFLVEGIALSFISSLQSPLLCCFYVCYLKKR